MIDFQFADLHCHPTLKPFGQSFSNVLTIEKMATKIWRSNQPTFLTKCLQKISGITKFSQADLTTMIKGNVKIAFVSLYPFEKGYFDSPCIPNKIMALLSSFVTSIGYNRVRYIQSHLDYFEDLFNEYEFLLRSSKQSVLNNVEYSFDFVKSLSCIDSNLKRNNHLSIIPTIEGAHVFNTGLYAYGKQLDEGLIFENIKSIKKLNHSPLFITFAHNFDNDLCGHAPSLECLEFVVDQSKKLHKGFTELGIKVLHCLLDRKNGPPILIDVKHMSLKSRLQYYDILKFDYGNAIPIIVSHGAVTGRKICGQVNSTLKPEYFANDSINFYDEELVIIAISKGLFAIQMDSKRLGPKHIIKKSVFKNNKDKNLKSSAKIVWRQLQHVAEVLDSNGLFAWGTCCIGSDFDGTINPLNEVWTSSDLNALANELVLIAKNYLYNPNALRQQRNKNISAEAVISNFTIQNTLNFLKNYAQCQIVSYE